MALPQSRPLSANERIVIEAALRYIPQASLAERAGGVTDRTLRALLAGRSGRLSSVTAFARAAAEVLSSPPVQEDDEHERSMAKAAREARKRIERGTLPPVRPQQRPHTGVATPFDRALQASRDADTARATELARSVGEQA